MAVSLSNDLSEIVKSVTGRDIEKVCNDRKNEIVDQYRICGLGKVPTDQLSDIILQMAEKHPEFIFAAKNGHCIKNVCEPNQKGCKTVIIEVA